jgi:D-tagatose-1,6-bisphosphate aldolase subunit GatZ/KbaZ
MQTNPLKNLPRHVFLAITCAEPFVIRTCMEYAKQNNAYFLVEATVNQVNQFGGYTGMLPKDYAAMIQDFARNIGFPIEKVILSGDHLGPFIWQNLPANEALENSRELVRQYVAAGFRKIHLDPTMPLADDGPRCVLSTEIIAERTAELAYAAEETYKNTADQTPWTFPPVYVIGSEVPIPGGTEVKEGMQVTLPKDLTESIRCFKSKFLSCGLKNVWDNVVAVVAQIGVEFSDETVYAYNHKAAAALSAELRKYPGLVFESHSSDYQTEACLLDMVKDGVGILKVGPELTFAFREALFALSFIEKELLNAYYLSPSNFIDTLETAMLTSLPNYWVKYYHGTPEQQKLKRRYSFSDRSRYYFARKEVRKSYEMLLRNLDNVHLPLTLISQYFPVQYTKICNSELEGKATCLVKDKISSVMNRYHSNISTYNL